MRKLIKFIRKNTETAHQTAYSISTLLLIRGLVSVVRSLFESDYDSYIWGYPYLEFASRVFVISFKVLILGYASELYLTKTIKNM